MAYRQYTQCVQPGDYSKLGFNTIGILNIIGMMLGAGLAAFIIAAIAGGPVGLAIAIAEMTLVVAYLHWWLNGRLICLGKEPCLIGMVRGLNASDPLTKAGDNDFTMNVLLAPGPTGFRKDFRANNQPIPPVSDYQNALQGDLVSPQSSISAIFMPYPGGEDHVEYMTGIHCEFEGSGIRNMLTYAEIVLALLVAALAALLIPGLGWLATALILLAIVLGGAGLLSGPLLGGAGEAGAGDPQDVSEDLKDLATGDIVVVRGTWVYDSLHEGWNEIHPVKDCCIVLPASKSHMEIGGVWPPGFTTAAEVQAQLDLWCPLIQDAHDCEDGGSRTDPKNDWILHPLVDGCSDVVIV